jgi:glycerol-3-phosphate dehydrogenase
MDHADYDVVIVGGGISGAAAARALTRRGYRILLLEQSDFASGSTSASTRLVQGGLQYLESGQARLLHESLRARERLLRERADLVRPQGFLLPVYEHEGRAPGLVRAGLALYDLLTPRKVAPWSRGYSLREARRMEPSLATEGLRSVYRFHDALVEMPERLCLTYLEEAREAGADLRNYASVDFIVGGEGGPGAVDFHDVRSGERHSATTRLVVNAAGPWVDRVLQETGRSMRRRLRLVKGTHVVLDLEGRGPAHALLSSEGLASERVSSGGLSLEGPWRGGLLVIPWLGHHVIGVAESIFEPEEPGEARPADQEIDALLAGAERLLPGIGVDRDHALYAYSGVWPWRAGMDGQERSGWGIVDHDEDGVPGLLSIVGGTLATAESTAERVVRAVRDRIGGPPRRGGPRALPARPSVNISFLAPETMAHLRKRYGQRSPDVAAYAGIDASLAEPISPLHPDIGAQVAYAVEQESARTVGDVLLRRTPVGRTRDLGHAAAPRVAAILADRLGWSAEERQQAVRDYDLELHRTVRVLRRRGETVAVTDVAAGAPMGPVADGKPASG